MFVSGYPTDRVNLPLTAFFLSKIKKNKNKQKSRVDNNDIVLHYSVAI